MPDIKSMPNSKEFNENYKLNFACCCCGSREGSKYTHEQMVAGCCLRCGRKNYDGGGDPDQKVIPTVQQPETNVQ